VEAKVLGDMGRCFSVMTSKSRYRVQRGRLRKETNGLILGEGRNHITNARVSDNGELTSNAQKIICICIVPEFHL